MAETRVVDSKYVSLDRRTLGIAILAAYGVGLWTHFVHWRSGAREAHDVTFWAHWMRDSTLSVPLVLMAVLIATMFVGRTARVVRSACATGAAVATALAMGVPVHVPGQPGYRDDTLFLQDTDPQIGSDFMLSPRWVLARSESVRASNISTSARAPNVHHVLTPLIT